MPWSTQANTREGWAAAKTAQRWAPSSEPNSAACSTEAASMTARMSSILASSVGRLVSSIRSERPVPRRSKTMTRANDPRRRRPRAKGSTRHMYSTLEAKPGTYTRSNGPLPNTW